MQRHIGTVEYQAMNDKISFKGTLSMYHMHMAHVHM